MRVQKTSPPDFHPLFNGKDLTGWTPVGRAVWRVEDGVIVGTQDGDASRSGVLDTKEQYQDFELAVPTGAGLGIELDDDRLRFFQRDGERRSISTAPARAGR